MENLIYIYIYAHGLILTSSLRLFQTDKASILDEVIEYVKQLQAQVQMMSRMSMSSMMMPMTMQQQLQMSMMAPMGMGVGMGMGMGMDMSTMVRPNIPTIPPIFPTAAFMPMASWDASAGGGDRLQGVPGTRVMPDPLSTFLACQSQVGKMVLFIFLLFYVQFIEYLNY